MYEVRNKIVKNPLNLNLNVFYRFNICSVELEIFHDEENSIVGVKRSDVIIDAVSYQILISNLSCHQTIFASTSRILYGAITKGAIESAYYFRTTNQPCSTRYMLRLVKEGAVIAVYNNNKFFTLNEKIAYVIEIFKKRKHQLSFISRASSWQNYTYNYPVDYLNWIKSIVKKNIHRIMQPYTRFARYIAYRKEINKAECIVNSVLEKKEIIFKPKYFALGDLLIISSLPRALFERYAVKFFLDEACKKEMIKNPFFELVFGINPYFCGFKKTGMPFQMLQVVHEKSMIDYLLDRRHINGCARLFNQFKLNDIALPEVYYEPKKLQEYENTILVDLNWRSGKKAGYYVDYSLIDEIIFELKDKNPSLVIEYVDEANQDIYGYIDKITSCHKFICMFSGGNVLAAAYSIPAYVILPETISNEAALEFMFLKSSINYIRRSAIPV